MSKGVTRRSVDVEDILWDDAKAQAEAEGHDLSEVLRAALRAYVVAE